MSVNTSPAPARTDTTATPRTRNDPTRAVRLGGLAMAAGAAAWALGTVLTYDVDPVDGEYPLAYKASSLLFQLGLVALVAVQLRTRATGTGRLARRFLHAEHVMLGLAIASSIQWMVAPDVSEDAIFLALDAFWPLSMLGMAAIGIRIAIAGRWRGPARVWPAVAETWVLVMLPVSALASAEVGSFVGAAHLLVGYTVLGLILALRPELTVARDR
ncbi:hypothetical protein SAMN05660662_0788 [Blastococcus aurantiacus]|uniref:Uncharacterized protein n=1 Tax=Blastococcus aurantiacus TaxID=1550231 RepID=A0A1G7HRZ1_9ACTN|nr:hypothetical protein [Blastococcus aurantiacus]SDF03175.1 hypothetical protein SAMN05660662_0788 [Blastococcus aurantiacus]